MDDKHLTFCFTCWSVFAFQVQLMRPRTASLTTTTVYCTVVTICLQSIGRRKQSLLETVGSLCLKSKELEKWKRKKSNWLSCLPTVLNLSKHRLELAFGPTRWIQWSRYSPSERSISLPNNGHEYRNNNGGQYRHNSGNIAINKLATV